MEATLLTLGVLLILVGLVGQVKATQIEVGTKNKFVRVILGLIGLVFVSIALSKMIPLPFLSGPAATQTATAPVVKATGTTIGVVFPITNTTIGPTTPALTEPPSPNANIATPTGLNLPSVTGFQTCLSLCSGQNRTDSFEGGVKKIYAQFNYANFPAGARYVRTWSLNGMEWIRYSCNWDGPASGTEVLTLKEPGGLHSGAWEITVAVNDVVLLKSQVTINGSWNYWQPGGVVNACHGTVN